MPFNLQEYDFNREELWHTMEQLKEENRMLKERCLVCLMRNVPHALPVIYHLENWFNFFWFLRLQRKEEEILGDLLYDLQSEKDKCKSLEAEVIIIVSFYHWGHGVILDFSCLIVTLYFSLVHFRRRHKK